MPLDSQFSVFYAIALDNYALIVCVHPMEISEPKIYYITQPLHYLKNQNDIVQKACDIVAPDAKIPEINQIIRNYLGFFTPKKLCGVDFPILPKISCLP